MRVGRDLRCIRWNVAWMGSHLLDVGIRFYFGLAGGVVPGCSMGMEDAVTRCRHPPGWLFEWPGAGDVAARRSGIARTC